MVEDKLPGYLLEFAVEADTEFQAMNRLKSLGITNADEAKLSDLDRQAGLYIIKISVNEADLTDETYGRILAANDIFILSDELSAKRAQEIIELTAPVEQQLKKLLICVLPETQKILSDIIETHQKHKSNTKPTGRIEWCKKISDFSFGELPKVIEEDIAELAKKQLLSSEGLLSLIISAEDFNTLKKELVELSKTKTVWNSICTILEKQVEYEHIAGQLTDLCNARNEAAHLNTITTKRLKEVTKSQKHVMSFISQTKSSYRDELRVNMDILAKSMKSIIDSAVKIDPSIFVGYQQMISETFKPLTDTVSRLQLNIASPAIANIIKQNTAYQSQITKSLTDSINNMPNLDLNVYRETMRQFNSAGISETISTYIKESSEIKIDIDKIIDEKTSRQDNSSTESDIENGKASDNERDVTDVTEEKKK